MLKHWRYRLEKGRPHLLLLIGLLLTIVGISVVGGLIVYLTGSGKGIAGSMWWTFLHVSDPGYLGDAEDAVSGFLGTLFTILGMITFMAGLVGILTSLITSGLKHLHEGGAPVAFENHVVIVGWNSRVFTLISDLLQASSHNQIALLASMDKTAAEKQLERRVFDPLERREGKKAARHARGSVVYRQGNAGNDHDLSRVSAEVAAKFVLLAEHDEASARAADVSQIRTLYSIQRVHFRSDKVNPNFMTVVEFTSEQFRSHAFYAVKANPRVDSWVNYYEERLKKAGERSFLPVPESDNAVNDMTAVNPNQIISRVLVQCAVQPFVSEVYDELFSFAGREMFLWEPDKSWEPVWTQMLRLEPANRPAFLGERMAEGLVIGSFHDGHIAFSPDKWSTLGDGAQYLVLGDKQSFTRQPRLEGELRSYGASCNVHLPEVARHYRVLILGVNRRFPMVMEQLFDYTEQYGSCQFTVHVVDENDVPPLVSTPDNVTLHRHQFDCTDWKCLGEFLEQSESFDSLILLAEDLSIDDSEVDARVTLILVMLRAFRDDPNWKPRLEGASLVAEVRDPRNRDILQQEMWSGDVIAGDGYVSGFLAQVCTDHRLEELYRELLDFGNYEVYSRDLNLPEDTTCFGNLVQSCAQQEEVAIGILQYRDGGRPRSLLAPDFSQPLTAKDKALVIAAN